MGRVHLGLEWVLVVVGEEELGAEAALLCEIAIECI